ncbi:hypothetical protein AAGY01_04265 [Staphylococcus aureus]
MEKNESNITDVTQNEEQLDNSDEQSQRNEKTFSQEEVSLNRLHLIGQIL